MNKTKFKPIIAGFFASLFLLALYFGVIALISGGEFAQEQFGRFWYFILGLAAGFGIKVGLYFYLWGVLHRKGPAGRVVAVSGTTSSIAMLSCCSHYLVNLLPILGISGFLAIVGQYQVGLFWVGIVANLLGILYIGRRVFP